MFYHAQESIIVRNEVDNTEYRIIISEYVEDFAHKDPEVLAEELNHMGEWQDNGSYECVHEYPLELKIIRVCANKNTKHTPIQLSDSVITDICDCMKTMHIDEVLTIYNNDLFSLYNR